MVEAARTMASTASIWVIVVVAVIVLAFWLTAIMLADRSQVRASGRARMAGEIGSAPDGAWVGGSVPGERDVPIPERAAGEPSGTRPRRAGDDYLPQGEVPTRADLPAQPAAAGRNAMPRQRTGDTDRAARSHAGTGTPDGEEPGRRNSQDSPEGD
jgi:hypothetical protein